MEFKIVLDPMAVEDIVEATTYIAEEAGIERARRWRSGLFEAIRGLESMPARYAMIPENELLGIEFRHLHHHTHRIVFEIDEEARKVIVARVYHGSRRPLRESDLA